MKFTLSWLKEYLDTDASPEVIAEKLIAIGLEVESVEDKGSVLRNFTVAEILHAEKHPDADKLNVCKVLTYAGERVIVCGAPNARAGIKVALADLGTTIPANGLVIEKRKVRGIESNGMLCSATELGLGDDSAGIIELPVDAKVGESIVNVLGLDDVLFDIAITPNRGDCLGVYGVARDLAAAGLGKLNLLDAEAVAGKGSAGRAIHLDTEDCRLFVGRLISGVQNGTSPEWLQKKLKSVGLRPISTLVDITNYFTIAYGRPLHVFDADLLRGDIRVRPSKDGESLEALNDKAYNLPEGLCAVCDDSGVIGLGGVVGGSSTGCTESTKNVFLEVAWFEPVAVARTGQALTVDSDARSRFERTVDPLFVLPGAEMATRMILELCGGEASEITVAGSAPDLVREIAFAPEDVQRIGGADVDAVKAESILNALGFIVAKNSTAWSVKNPSWRPDMESRADIVEEILRIAGYDLIPELSLPQAMGEASESAALPEWELRTTLVQRGLKESTHFGFVSAKEAAPFMGSSERVSVINPISADLDTMRPSLLPGLLTALKRNMARDYFELGLFECGTVFHGPGAEQQPLMLAGVRTGHEPQFWEGKPRAYDIFDVKADAFALLETLGFTGRVQVTSDVPQWYHPGKSGSLRLGKQVLGTFGEVHPAILRTWKIEQPVMAFELFPHAVPRKAKKEREAIRLSDYQAVVRDFAFVVNADVPADDLLGAVRGAEKKLVQKVELFDVYEGKNVDAGKKSLAVSVTLQAGDRTLTEDEISKVAQAIVAAAQKFGASLRV